MKQLLESINRVNAAQHRSVRHFEAHIFFDGGVKETQPTEFALQLLSLLPETLGLSVYSSISNYFSLVDTQDAFFNESKNGCHIVY